MPPDAPPDQTVVKKGTTFETLKKGYERFVKIRGNPREIALGFSLGLFVGMSPAMGFQTAIAVFVAALFKWNKISSAIGVWISNPFTAPLLYSITYFVGATIFGFANPSYQPAEFSGTSIATLLHKAPEILWALVLGGIVLGLPVAVAGYFFSYSAIHKYQEGARKKLAARTMKRALRKKRKRVTKQKKK